MDMKQLQEFVDLAETCNFHETARNLNTTQSSISKHLSKLEKEFDTQLFDRSAGTVRLSECGMFFLNYAKKILCLNEEVSAELNRRKRSRDNTLCIGFHPMFGQYGLVELISQFSNEHPEISLNLIDDRNTEELLKTLQCDVAFAPEHDLVNPSLHQILYTRDRLVVICSKDHPLAQAKAVTLSQLQDENFIAHCPLSCLQKDSVNFPRICKEKGGFTPKVVATVNMTSTVVQFVSQGKGIALLFRKHLPGNTRGVIPVDIIPEIPFNICIFYLKNRSQPASLATFLRYMESIANGQ